MNIVEYVSLLQVGTSSGYMPRRDIAGSSSSTMSNFLRNLQTDFQSVCTSLQSHQQWRSVPLSRYPHQHLLSPEFFFRFMENLLQLSNTELFFLFNILLCSFLRPFCSDAKESGIGTGHSETGKSLKVLLFFCDDSGLFLLVHILDGHHRSC